MYFDTVQALLEMDGHGGFVWSAYLITLLVLALATQRRAVCLQPPWAPRARLPQHGLIHLRDLARIELAFDAAGAAAHRGGQRGWCGRSDGPPRRRHRREAG